MKKVQEYLAKTASNGQVNKSNSTESDQNQESLNQFVRLMDSNEKLQRDFDKEMFEFCIKQGGLERFEAPTKSKFVREIWLPDSGLVTDSLKLKRREIEKFYENDIRKVYV